jgi:hypothetical protein
VVNIARPIRLVARPDGGARTHGPVQDADRPQLALIRGYRDELEPIVQVFGAVEVFIRPATPVPPAPDWPPKPKLPRNWQDMDGWRALLRHAHLVEHRRWVLARWAKAAGGEVRDGTLRLPTELPRGLALAELKTHARIVGLTIEDLR